MAQLSSFFRRPPKPRCPACHKWNRVYLTGGSYLWNCVQCGAALELRRPIALWSILAVLGVSVLVLVAALPLLYR